MVWRMTVASEWELASLKLAPRGVCFQLAIALVTFWFYLARQVNNAGIYSTKKLQFLALRYQKVRLRLTVKRYFYLRLNKVSHSEQRTKIEQ